MHVDGQGRATGVHHKRHLVVLPQLLALAPTALELLSKAAFLQRPGETGEIPFRKQELEDLYIELGRQDFPPKHHSKIYGETHKPAYRIVLKQHWEGFKGEKQE